MNLISISRAIRPFMDDTNLSLESIYRVIMSNSYIKDIRELMKPSQIIKLVFIADAVYQEKDVESLINELNSNLFIFSVVEFGEINNSIECNSCNESGNEVCEDCYGGGLVSCDNCGGEGTVNCSECDGDGTVDCPDCNGDGVDEEGDECGNCDGRGKITCDYCEGNKEITCDDCKGEKDVTCQNCDGTGNVQCYYCNGDGVTYTNEFLPYDVYEYASYDQNVLSTINTVERKDFELNKTKKTFLLNTITVNAGDEDTDEIDQTHEDGVFLLNVVTGDIDEVLYKNKNITQDTPAEIQDFYA
jgi:hypothetical protein